MAGGFVEEDAGGDGGVEAFDGTGGGYGDGGVAAGSQVLGDTVAFVANEEGNGAGEMGGLSGLGTVDCCGEDAKASGAEAVKTFVGGGVDEWETEYTSGGGAESLCVPGADGSGEGDDAGCAKGLGGAEDGAEVAGVL